MAIPREIVTLSRRDGRGPVADPPDVDNGGVRSVAIEQFVTEGEERVGGEGVNLEEDGGLFPLKDIVDPARDATPTTEVLLAKEGMDSAGPIDRLDDGPGLGAERGIGLMTGAVGDEVEGRRSGPTDHLKDEPGQIGAIEEKEDDWMTNQGRISRWSHQPGRVRERIQERPAMRR